MVSFWEILSLSRLAIIIQTFETEFSEITTTSGNQLNHGQQLQNSISLPNGSKAVRKSNCQVCHVDVCTTARQRHVYQFHLRISNLFQCSGCDYTNNNSIWEMRKHCIAIHQGNAYPISNEESHKHEIQVIHFQLNFSFSFLFLKRFCLICYNNLMLCFYIYIIGKFAPQQYSYN